MHSGWYQHFSVRFCLVQVAQRFGGLQQHGGNPGLFEGYRRSVFQNPYRFVEFRRDRFYRICFRPFIRTGRVDVLVIFWSGVQPTKGQPVVWHGIGPVRYNHQQFLQDNLIDQPPQLTVMRGIYP